MNIVYWGIPKTENLYIHYYPPVNIKEKYKLFKPTNPDSNFNRCPSYKVEGSKLFNILSPFDYNLIFENEELKTNYYDQEFFNNLVKIDDLKIKLFQFNIQYIFFTENPCYMTLGPPYFSNSDMSVKCNYIPGGFDISKWFRNINVGVILKDKYNDITLKQGDEIISVKFDFFNNDSIQLKKFYVTDALMEIHRGNMASRTYIPKNINTYLDTLYQKFNNSKLRSIIFKEIKNNLME